jgi:Mrp family chromosome partitioning ATPase
MMAQAGLRTVIVDANLRNPIQHDLLQMENRRGVIEFLCRSQLIDKIYKIYRVKIL